MNNNHHSPRPHTPGRLFSAVLRGDHDTVVAALASGVDPNCQAKGFGLPLYQCCKSKNSSANTLRALLEAGANPTLVSNKETGLSPLHVAASRGCTEFARLLLEAGADVNALDSAGNTPLHLAVDPGLARTLVERGADPTTENDDGLTAERYLEAKGHYDTAQFLRDLSRAQRYQLALMDVAKQSRPVGSPAEEVNQHARAM